MSEHLIVPDPGPQGTESGIVQTDTKKKTKGKKKDRIRAAWISFVSRILAQFIGAAAPGLESRARRAIRRARQRQRCARHRLPGRAAAEGLLARPAAAGPR